LLNAENSCDQFKHEQNLNGNTLNEVYNHIDFYLNAKIRGTTVNVIFFLLKLSQITESDVVKI